MLIPFAFLAVGLVLLIVCADVLVRGASGLALRLGMTPLSVGLIVVAFGTSAPELIASVVAGLAGSSGMALGNVVGSNVSNIALVLGVAAVIRPLPVERQILRVDAPISIAASLLLVGFLLDGRLSRIEGGVLFAGIVAYVGWTLKKAKSGDIEAGEEVDESTASMPLWKAWGLAFIGLIGLSIGANLFVRGAQDLAAIFGISEAVVGLTVMAIGTSLPEIATVVAASMRGMSGLVTGNAIGSNIFNVLAVLGAAALIVPLDTKQLTQTDLIVFVASAVIVWGMMWGRSQLSRLEGALLLIAYVSYVVWLFL
ncbi:MAG: calcium/sodium antiporter [Bacteroidota bacterium]